MAAKIGKLFSSFGDKDTAAEKEHRKKVAAAALKAKLKVRAIKKASEKKD